MSAPVPAASDTAGRERILKMAHLARLKLESDEVEVYSRQLDSILGYIDQLQSIDLEGVGPMLSPVGGGGSAVSPLREDRVDSAVSDHSADVVSCGPEVSAGAFVVPPVL